MNKNISKFVHDFVISNCFEIQTTVRRGFSFCNSATSVYIEYEIIKTSRHEHSRGATPVYLIQTEEGG